MSNIHSKFHFSSNVSLIFQRKGTLTRWGGGGKMIDWLEDHGGGGGFGHLVIWLKKAMIIVFICDANMEKTKRDSTAKQSIPCAKARNIYIVLWSIHCNFNSIFTFTHHHRMYMQRNIYALMVCGHFQMTQQKLLYRVYKKKGDLQKSTILLKFECLFNCTYAEPYCVKYRHQYCHQ